MSLEKFQATEAWRNKFKNLLFTERKPSFVDPVAASAQLPQRLSFELSEDLQVILEEKKIPREGLKMPRVRDEEENKENFEEQKVDKLHSNAPGKLKRSQRIDSTLFEDSNEVLQITNTSFETLEEMCEKTASDPDSTLFQYLHRESTSVLQATRAEKLQSYDEEADALQRLLDELNLEETEKRLKGQTSANDTQLDEVEEPSRFWENTLTAETLQSISPVKMVGLMRQSTIMEECSDFSGSDGCSTSYQSAMKTSCSSETTGCYETANETAACSEKAAVKKVSIDSSGASSSSSCSDLFQQRHSRQKFFNDDDKSEDPLEKSIQLIDLETTFMVPSSRNSMESVNEPIPDTPDSPEPAESSKSSSEDYSLEPLKSSPETTQVKESDESSSVIELSDDESLRCSNILKKIEKLESESPLNRSFTVKSEDNEDEKSLHFNDTMEEVEYMMKKGMQYMQAHEAKEAPSPMKSHLTPVKKAERYRSPSPMLSSPITPKTVIAKPKPVNKHALDIKPFPKLTLFKKPQGSGLRPPAIQNKFVSSVKKQQYAHVISPIGAYIKKTPTTPLISTIKPGNTDSAATSKAFKQLEYDSRVTPHDSAASSKPSSPMKTHFCSLPKKAYVSAECKHIVDGRTQFTIPGGPKIQRYLISSMVPAIVRHEGRMKIPANLRTSDMAPPAPRATDDSLADLSMISGDVSLYTIKDAQKF